MINKDEFGEVVMTEKTADGLPSERDYDELVATATKGASEVVHLRVGPLRAVVIDESSVFPLWQLLWIDPLRLLGKTDLMDVYAQEFTSRLECLTEFDRVCALRNAEGNE